MLHSKRRYLPVNPVLDPELVLSASHQQDLNALADRLPRNGRQHLGFSNDQDNDYAVAYTRYIASHIGAVIIDSWV